MRKTGRFVVLALLAFLFVFSSPAVFAKMPTSSSPSSPPSSSDDSHGHHHPQTYNLTLSVQGSWHQDPSYHCPGQCQANDRFYAKGTLTYSNSTTSTTVSIRLNGTAHSNWAGVNMNNPCTTITANVNVVTNNHDKIHMQVSGTDCWSFVNGVYTGRNVLTETYTIMSGEGLFSEASGSGTVGGYGYPGSQSWIASAGGTITFTAKAHE